MHKVYLRGITSNKFYCNTNVNDIIHKPSLSLQAMKKNPEKENNVHFDVGHIILAIDVWEFRHA